MPTQKGGGSVGQSLRYVDPAAPEQSAPAGSDLLKQSGLIARPAIGGGTRKKRGGFYPSVMSGVVNAGVVLAPLTAMAARKLWSRKGGTRKGNRWAAEKEEAKRMLEGIGKPSAKNVLAFAAAKRRGSGPTEEYLNQYRKKVQEKQEANESRRRAKEEKKAERAAKKASKKAKKAPAAEAAAGKPPSAASSASTASTRSRSGSMSSNNSGPYRPPTKAQLLREAQENAARAAAELKAAKAKRPVKNSQLAWFTLIDNAQKKLAADGTPSRKNAMKYASLLKQGKTEEAEAFLANFRARSRKSNKKTAAKAASASGNGNGNGAAAAAAPSAAPKKSRKVKASEKGNGNGAASAAPKKSRKVKASAAAAAGNNGSAKKPKEHSAASKAYFNALKTSYVELKKLGQGKAKAGNAAKRASLVVSKQENAANRLAAFNREYASRFGAAAAEAKPAKALTTVAEANEANESNSMQGYSENFEPEED